MAKIFISYKRNVEPDTPVAEAVYQALRQEHQVFIDTTLEVGEKWAERIQHEIKESDYLICFLSEHSIQSEMVIAEIETAHHQCKASGCPVILPVRLAYDKPFTYPLSAYLNPLQWAIWNNEADTSALITELSRAVQGESLPDKPVQIVPENGEQQAPTAFADIDLEAPEGTMVSNSPFYIQRAGDAIALNALQRQGVTITIKAPRQMGKSSLLARIMGEAKSDQRVIFLDFQMMEKATLQNAESFYRMFCSWVSFELDLEDQTEHFWKLPLGQVQRTSHYFQKHILPNLNRPLLLAMDEVERMFDTPFRSDFFSMLRSWHNNRATKPVWRNYNQALVTSTEPYQFIADLNQSPFNVGEVIELRDFSSTQVADLNRRHKSPLKGRLVKQLANLLNGHPYLTRKALYLLATGQIDFNNLLTTACDDGGPFGDHLRNHLYRLHGQDELKAAFKGIIQHGVCDDEQLFFRLRGAGLVKRIGDQVLPRNPLYAEYYGKRLDD